MPWPVWQALRYLLALSALSALALVVRSVALLVAMHPEAELAKVGTLVSTRLRAGIATVLGERKTNLDAIARGDVLAVLRLRVSATVRTASRWGALSATADRRGASAGEGCHQDLRGLLFCPGLLSPLDDGRVRQGRRFVPASLELRLHLRRDAGGVLLVGRRRLAASLPRWSASLRAPPCRR